MTHARAAVLSVGDELTLGQTLDTNSQWLSQRLASLGISVACHMTVPDDLDAQTRALRDLAGRVDLLICSGGLGPTADDLTRQAIAGALGEELVEDPASLEQVREFFRSRGREMPAINAVQAQRPSSATSLANPVGTAPGLHAILRFEGHACDLFCLPGPPKEMMPMFEAQVLPRLRLPSSTLITRAIHTVGIGESDLAMRLGSLMARDRMPLIGTTASGGVVSVRLRYAGPLGQEEAAALLDRDERAVRSLAGPHAFGAGETTLAETVVHTMRSRHRTLALAESCSGGRLAGLITDVPGSSAVFLSGWVTYSNQAKVRDLGVDEALLAIGGPGAVSHETACAMARGALARSGATNALGVTGIAGPSGGSMEKPVGTVHVALASRGDVEVRVDSRRFQLPGDRASVRDWSSTCALAMLWLHLAGAPGTPLLRQVDRRVDGS